MTSPFISLSLPRRGTEGEEDRERLYPLLRRGIEGEVDLIYAESICQY